MRVVLMSGNRSISQRLGEMFARENTARCNFYYEFTAMQDMQTVLSAHDDIHPDLYLLDLAVADAITVCRRIRDREGERHTGVIFIDNRGQHRNSVVRCLELGGDDWIEGKVSDGEIFARINAVLRLKAMTDELRSANHRLKILSHTDELTGLHNMRSFNQNYAVALNECREGKYGLGVIMLDLDHFKSINDSSNHLVGSFVISQVGRLIKGVGILGSEDCPARYGGDEYVIFTRDNSLVDVESKARRIGETIARAVFEREGLRIQVTASIGVSWVDKGYSGEDESPIKAADLMLYKSKKTGRNCLSSVTVDQNTDLNQMGEYEISETGVAGPKKIAC